MALNCQQAEKEQDHVGNTGLIFLTKYGGMDFIPSPRKLFVRDATQPLSISPFLLSGLTVPLASYPHRANKVKHVCLNENWLCPGHEQGASLRFMAELIGSFSNIM